MKLLSHLMKLLHLMTLPSQQFCLCGTPFNVHDTFIKHALRLALVQRNSQPLVGHNWALDTPKNVRIDVPLLGHSQCRLYHRI